MTRDAKPDIAIPRTITMGPDTPVLFRSLNSLVFHPTDPGMSDNDPRLFAQLLCAARHSLCQRVVDAAVQLFAQLPGVFARCQRENGRCAAVDRQRRVAPGVAQQKPCRCLGHHV